jgi:hypothetical protein
MLHLSCGFVGGWGTTRRWLPRFFRFFVRTQVQFLAACRSLEKEVEAQTPRHPDQPFWLITIRFGQHRSRAAIEWCDETLRSLTRNARGAKAR